MYGEQHVINAYRVYNWWIVSPCVRSSRWLGVKNRVSRNRLNEAEMLKKNNDNNKIFAHW